MLVHRVAKAMAIHLEPLLRIVCPPEELPRASPSGASCCCYVLVFLQRLFATFSSGKFVVGPVQVQARFQGFTRETDHRSLLDYLDHSREYLYVAAHVTG